MRFSVSRLACAMAVLALTRVGAQEATPVLQVAGDVEHQLTLSPDDFAKLPRATVRTVSDGIETAYEGVWVHEVLKKAGAPQGSALRGKALASYVLAQAEDGYQVVFSLAELDPGFIDNQILLADSANGKPLFGAQGRYRLVVPKDRPG